MAHLTGFGLENFRVFKEETWFDFAPITVLTGPNNSGKSSLIKGLLAVKQTFSNRSIGVFNPLSIDFKLAGLQNLINFDSNKRTITLVFPLYFQIFNKILKIKLEYSYHDEKFKGNFLTSFEISYKSKPIISFKTFAIVLPILRTAICQS